MSLEGVLPHDVARLIELRTQQIVNVRSFLRASHPAGQKRYDQRGRLTRAENRLAHPIVALLLVFVAQIKLDVLGDVILQVSYKGNQDLNEIAHRDDQQAEHVVAHRAISSELRLAALDNLERRDDLLLHLVRLRFHGVEGRDHRVQPRKNDLVQHAEPLLNEAPERPQPRKKQLDVAVGQQLEPAVDQRNHRRHILHFQTHCIGVQGKYVAIPRAPAEFRHLKVVVLLQLRQSERAYAALDMRSSRPVRRIARRGAFVRNFVQARGGVSALRVVAKKLVSRMPVRMRQWTVSRGRSGRRRLRGRDGAQVRRVVLRAAWGDTSLVRVPAAVVEIRLGPVASIACRRRLGGDWGKLRKLDLVAIEVGAQRIDVGVCARGGLTACV
mmetsp:Transcript_11473/g.30908  ORF Transcript_11473/g.30908 Transcript_11473/m.30908 type:complete len:384 (-) Transcript_11473:527-1678(-)